MKSNWELVIGNWWRLSSEVFGANFDTGGLYVLSRLTLGYLAYWWMQPANSKRSQGEGGGSTALPLQARQTDKPYGPGQERVGEEVRCGDGQARVAFQGRTTTQPRNDGWMTVKQPRGAVLHEGRPRDHASKGETGEVIMDDNSKTGMKALPGSRDTPSRGRLYNVTIHLYHEIDQPEEQLDEETRRASARTSPSRR